MSINAQEQIWASALPNACAQNNPPAAVRAFACGISARFEASTATITACAQIPEVDTISSAYAADPDIGDIEDYATYIGNGRRVITVPIVELLSPTGTMTVIGFRQFLVVPNQGDINTNPADANARFRVLYIGSVMPLRQGSFGGCQSTYGPGKVVLYQ
jgi:hypothetical protein